MCKYNPSTLNSCPIYIANYDSYATLNYTDMITLPTLSLVQGYNYFNSTTIGSITVTNYHMPILMSGTDQMLSIPIDFSAGGNYFDYTFLDLNKSVKQIISVKAAYANRARYYVKIKYAGSFDKSIVTQYAYKTPGQYNFNVYVKTPNSSASTTINVIDQTTTTSVKTSVASTQLISSKYSYFTNTAAYTSKFLENVTVSSSLEGATSLETFGTTSSSKNSTNEVYGGKSFQNFF